MPRAILDLDAIELAAPGSRHHDVQLLMQRRSPGLDELARIGLLGDAEVPSRFGGQEIILKGAVIAAARDPDVAAAQTLAQHGKHGDLV